MMLSANIDFATWLSLSGVVIAAIAASATLVAVYFAYRTIKESESATKAAWARHREQIDKLEAATAAAARQHEREMADRDAAEEIQRQARQVAQLQRLADVYAELVDAARNQVTKIDQSMPRLPTNIPTLQTKTQVETRVLKALGGPNLTKLIPEPTPDYARDGLVLLQESAMKALTEIDGVVKRYDTFRSDDT